MPSFEIPAIRVFVIAPVLLAWSIERAIHDAHPLVTPVGSAVDIASALQAAPWDGVDVALTTLLDEEGPKALPQLCASSGVKILVVTNSADEESGDSAMISGARGIISVRDAPATLVKAIEAVYRGELWIDRSATSRIFMRMVRRKADQPPGLEQSLIATLTLRERQALVVVVGHAAEPTKMVAGRLCISEHTLRNHLSSIYAKLGLSNRGALYEFAIRHKLCTLE